MRKPREKKLQKVYANWTTSI